jgi:signal transduction histidine kinase
MRRRVLIGFVVFSAIVAIALAMPLGFSLASNQRNTAISSLERDGASLSVVLAEALERGDTTTAARIVASYAHANDVGAAVVRDGRVVVSSSAGMGEELTDGGIPAILHSAARGRVSGIAPTREGDDRQFYAALSVGAAPHGDGKPAPASSDVLLLTAPAGPVDDVIRRQWLELLGFGIAVVAFAALVGWLLARSLLHPLRRIEVAVAKIGAGQLDTRAPEQEGPAELRALAGTVNSMAARLGELVSSQRAFVADASHQLRSPLTALRLRLEADLAGSGGAENLAKALGEVERLGRLVDGLLALARAEGTRQPLTGIDVAAVINDRAGMWRPLAEESGITLEAQARQEPALFALAGDGYLEQMLDNLIANAVEATPPGRRVQLTYQLAGDWVETHVVDEGPGMTVDDRRRAFDRFWSRSGNGGSESSGSADGSGSGTDTGSGDGRGGRDDNTAGNGNGNGNGTGTGNGAATRGYSGTGLGLPIVEQLARVSGGTVELLESETGGVDAVIRLRVQKGKQRGGSGGALIADR